ncbi:hypothetical protein PG993_011815 [Apiospora rasikravindrae]|uniref:histidine kinase n=1 Tax=Apiospora rasikravindrae TaxID=990691 RepID=A0ABR1S2Y3_9PEZI
MGSRVRESVREREVLRSHLHSYDPALLDNITYNDTAVPIPDAQLRTSHDPVLTSLAQLGACRTGTARGIISLFDKEWQFIVAEATQNISLLPNLGAEDRDGEELWLCQTAIPRTHGVCEWTLLYDGETEASSEELPVTIVNDLQADDRFCLKPYCAPGSPARFYASVPIRSPRGINIGVYCLMHTEPIAEQDAKAAGIDVVIRHVTRTIMNHLELRRSAVALKRSENMMLGVASYISNDNTATNGFQTNIHPPHSKEKGSNSPAPISSRHTDNIESSNQPDEASTRLSIDVCGDKDHSAGGNIQGGNAGTGSHNGDCASQTDVSSRTICATSIPAGLSLSSDGDDLSLGGIFTRAASVVCRSLNIGDVTFFSASSGSFGSRVDTLPGRDQPSDPFRTSYSSYGTPQQSRGHDSGTCPMLGTSRPDISDSNAPSSIGAPRSLSASLLSSLLKRHPRGRVFNFDEHGVLQTSESSEDSAKFLRDGIPTQKSHKTTMKTRWSRQRRGKALLDIFPGARSICFAPIWDDRRERWYAGGLACTYEHNRILTPSVELSYLRAFGTLLMADVHRFETTRSHQAQSDVLGSISHELRSPLHGLILSAELLADTHIDALQENILHTIETCGRTLLDTVDHLLDYSKVNHFMNSNRRRKARGTRGKGLSIEDGMKTQVSDVRLDTLVEEVVESVFAGFRRMSTEYSLHHDRRRATDPDIGAVRASSLGVGDTMHPWNSSHHGDGKSPSMPASVALYVDIEPSESYKCRTDAGAIRRVVMNLLGNSLKYTERGRIEVRLSRDAVSTRRRGVRQKMIRIVVADTGKGMSKDFLANYLYKPFSQEDPLSAGTGLGLSLVKKLVSSLGGEISVKSELNVGSAVTVLLPLPPADHEAAEHKEEEGFAAQRQMLKGLRVRLVGYNHATDESETSTFGGVSTVEKVCKGWLGMEVISESSDLTPDVIVCVNSSLEAALGTQAFAAKPPMVVVCPNAVIAHSRTMNSSLPRDGQVYEFISQPTGPRKLARVLLLAFNRWLELQDVSNHHPRPPTNHGAGWLNPSGTGSVATQMESYFPMTESPQKISDTSEAESHRPQETSDCPTGAMLCPLRPALPPASPSRPSTPSSQSGPTSTSATEFLLVDDNPINLRILCAYMKKLNRAFTTAVDGMEAVEAFKANPGRFTCILMDINMPRLDGLKATQQIRSYERDLGAEKACPIFALTGLASAETQREAFESGIGLFLTKPVKLKELSEILRARGLI